MGINIWLPIVVNVLILGIMVAGAFIGRKNGFLYELLKLVTLCACGVGIYFLNPIVADLLVKIPFVEHFIAEGLCTLELIRAVSFVLLFIFVYIITTIIFKIIKKTRAKKTKVEVKALNGKKFINTAKPAKISGLNKKETRRLNKEQRKLARQRKKQDKQLEKASRKPLTSKQKVFGIIFGILTAFIIGFVITIPLKPIFTKIAEVQPEIAEVEKGYEYTPYGQIDKLIGVVDFIIK